MKTYELTYIISPDMTAEAAQTKSKELQTQIQGKEGIILRADNPVAKTLSYQIKKFGSGFFAFIEFQAEPEAMTEIKNHLEKDKQFLRHIVLVKNPAKKQKERRRRIKPEAEIKIEEEKTEEVKKEEVMEVKPETEKKPSTKKVKAEKSKEKAEMEDIDKKLDEILSE